ncbi:MAG: DUF2934 domain-containing protein [Methylobacter sp.]|nr:DUF2934 domain-containing protein [Methylobacter sp.]
MLNTEVKAINRHRWISEAAYYRAEARGFESGKELNDWLEAEIEYAKMLIALYSSILEEDEAMTILSLQQLAGFIGIQNPESMLSEIELVRAIQDATEHSPCFRSEINMTCEEVECKWRTECRKMISVWY